MGGIYDSAAKVLCGSAAHPGGGIMGAPGETRLGVIKSGNDESRYAMYARNLALQFAKMTSDSSFRATNVPVDVLAIARPNGLVAAALLARRQLRRHR